MSERPNLEALRPADTPSYMTPAWIGCISFALHQPELVRQFRDDTGFHWTPGRSGLERMIDEATGMQWEFIKAFVLWVNANVWGPIEGPSCEN